MDLGLHGKTALITGGSKGIGRAAALRLVQEGACVLVCARGQEALKQTAAAARNAVEGARVLTVSADLTQPDDIRRVVAEGLRALGRLDILVNNGGGARPGSS